MEVSLRGALATKQSVCSSKACFALSNKAQILVETVIAVGILGIAIAATIIVMTKATKTVGDVRELQAATFLVMEEAELIKNVPYPYGDDPANTDAYDNIASRSLTGINRSGFTFDLNRVVTDTLDSANNQVKKQIVITITRTGEPNPTVTYRTHRVRDGI